MQSSLYPYQLKFKYPFKISHGLRSYTDVVYVKLEHENYTAWGEATLPPYLSETQQSVIDFISAFQKSMPSNNIGDWFDKLSNDQSGNMSAKAALDMALWSLKAQTEGTTIGDLLGIEQSGFPLCTYTIGICTFDEMKLKVDDTNNVGFEIFKIKLNGTDDEEMIRNFKKLSSKPFAVDVNQGWQSSKQAIEKINWLGAEGCLLVEQPLPKELLSEMKEVKEKSTLPVFADESCQGFVDIETLKDCFDGVNIKLMKCGGITEAFRMIKKAREVNLKILVGCMSESSVGCSAAASLSSMADYADLDGPYLIVNDPFEGMKVEHGRIALHQLTQKIKF